MGVFTRATKRKARARVALAGPTGSGKTWNALIWATALGGRVALIDTERGSASLFAPHFDFDTVEFNPPYDPARLMKLLKIAEGEGYDVVVVDSLSHFWEGEGGTLDVVEAAGQRAGGNKWAGWKVGTPLQRDMLDAMLQSPLHVVATMRTKMEWVLETDDRGKQKPLKVGMAPVQRGDVEYEFTVVADLDLEHRVTISKTRCHDLADLVVEKHRATEPAALFAAWLEEGDQAPDPSPEPVTHPVPDEPSAPVPTEDTPAPAAQPAAAQPAPVGAGGPAPRKPKIPTGNALSELSDVDEQSLRYWVNQITPGLFAALETKAAKTYPLSTQGRLQVRHFVTILKAAEAHPDYHGG